MNLRIKEVNSVLDLCEIIKLSNQHTNPEYDCDWETYAKFILNAYYTPGYKMWITVDDGFPVGYLMTYRDTGLLNEIRVVDIFILPGWQGKGIGLELIKMMTPYVYAQGVKRVKWHSKVSPELSSWAKWSPDIEIHKESIFSVDVES